MRIKLLPKQGEFLRATETVVAYCGGRGTGKSVVASWVAVRELMDGRSGMVIAPIFDDLRSVMIKNIISFLDTVNVDYNHNKSEHTIKVGDAILYYQSAETENGIRGKSNLSFLIVDEAATVDYEIYLIAKACLRGDKVRNPRTFLVGTPRGKGNWFYDICFAEGTRLIRAKTTDNNFLDPSFHSDLQNLYSDNFAKQELDGEFIDDGSCTVFSDEEWLKLVTPKTLSGDKVVVGVDVASGGDNSSSTVLRGNQLVNITSRKTTTDIQTLVALVEESLGGLEPDYIVVDSTGIGTFAPSEFKKKWPKATICPVNFSSKAHKVGYTLRRDEIYFDLKKKINSGLHFGPRITEEQKKKIRKQFFATEFIISNKSDFKLIPKSEISSKIGCSPDELDSIALASSLDVVAIEKYKSNDLNSNKNQVLFSNRRS